MNWVIAASSRRASRFPFPALKMSMTISKASNQASLAPIPLVWGNGLEGDIHGVEVWGDLLAADWWRLSAGFNIQHDDIKFSSSSAGLIGVQQAGNDPHHQASLRSTITLPGDVTFESDFRDVGQLANPKVPEYVELNAKLNWRASETLDFSLSGLNLLHGQHVEFSPGDEIKRSVYLETKLRF
jgi:iron complex outermembrane receptor protein